MSDSTLVSLSQNEWEILVFFISKAMSSKHIKYNEPEIREIMTKLTNQVY